MLPVDRIIEVNEGAGSGGGRRGGWGVGIRCEGREGGVANRGEPAGAAVIQSARMILPIGGGAI